MLEAFQQSALEQRAISKVFPMQYSVNHCCLRAARQPLAQGMRMRARGHLGRRGRLMKWGRVKGGMVEGEV